MDNSSLTIAKTEFSSKGSNVEKLDLYEYDSLPTATSIRILKVISKYSDDKLKCSLRTVDLEESPQYQALSYTWGNPYAKGGPFQRHFDEVASKYVADVKIPIFCDNRVIYVQQNLYDFLKLFPTILGNVPACSRDDPTTALVMQCNEIWIDALCINQQSNPERSSQVQIMDLIYMRALHTIIWFGREDKYTELAAHSIRKIATYPRESFARSDVKPYRPQTAETYEKSGLEYTSIDEWNAIAALFLREWFSRVWIVQEACRLL
jgi:hypothetical protein